LKTSTSQISAWLCTKSRHSALLCCNLRVLCVSVVDEFPSKNTPQRHREHGGCTEKSRTRTFCAKPLSLEILVRLILTVGRAANYSRAVIRKWLTSVALTIVMLTATIGVGAHQWEGSCPTSKLPDCCKKARSNGPQASMARLCCNLNCSEPGSTGSSSSSFSAQQLSTTNTPVILNAAEFNFRIVFPRPSQRIQLHESNPRYIKHLALLI